MEFIRSNNERKQRVSANEVTRHRIFTKEQATWKLNENIRAHIYNPANNEQRERKVLRYMYYI